MGVSTIPNNPADLDAQHQLSSHYVEPCSVAVINQPKSTQAAKPTVPKADMAEVTPSLTKRQIPTQSILTALRQAAAESQIGLTLLSKFG
jgi:hypothetical protein